MTYSKMRGKPVFPHFPFRLAGKGAAASRQAQRPKIPKGLPFGAGLGWHEAQRRGLGDDASHQSQKTG
jgi:hypothetical protein